jgi:hypothetical protein
MTKVNITLEAYREAFGHDPSPNQLALLMSLKAKQEKQKCVSTTSGIMEKSKIAKESRKKKENLENRGPIRVSLRTVATNKMLNYGLESKQIADVMEVDQKVIDHLIMKYNLPRKNDDMLAWKYKNGHKF